MSIEAMKQAMAALESCAPADTSSGHVIYPSFDEKLVDQACEALRTAIQQAEAKTDEPVGYMSYSQIVQLRDRQVSHAYVYPTKDLSTVHPIYTHPAPGVPDADFDLQELREIERAMDDFADCGETDVGDTLLMRAVRAGFLECTHFHVANRGALQDAIDAAMLTATQAQKG